MGCSAIYYVNGNGTDSWGVLTYTICSAILMVMVNVFRCSDLLHVYINGNGKDVWVSWHATCSSMLMVIQLVQGIFKN